MERQNATTQAQVSAACKAYAALTGSISRDAMEAALTAAAAVGYDGFGIAIVRRNAAWETIDRCAEVADIYDKGHTYLAYPTAGQAIRALKEKL